MIIDLDCLCPDKKSESVSRLPTEINHALDLIGFRRCLLIDEIQHYSLVPRYEVDSVAHGLSVDGRVSMFTCSGAKTQEVVSPVHRAIVKTDPSADANAIFDKIHAKEEQLILQTLTSCSPTKTQHAFGTPAFFDAGFRHIENSNDGVVYHVLINKDNYNFVSKAMADVLEDTGGRLHLWTAALWLTNCLPANTALFLDAPDSVGVISIINEWRQTGECEWSSDIGILVQPCAVAWMEHLS